MLGLGLAMLAITAIGVGGMAVSVVVAEGMQGSGSAINVAGSLRRLSHRMGSLVLSDAENGVANHQILSRAIREFDATLDHPALRAAIGRRPDSNYAHAYDAVRQLWQGRLRPLLLEEARPGVDAHPPSRHNILLAAIDAFVDRINTMVAQLEADTETTIRQLRSILAAALVLTLVVMAAAMLIVRRKVLTPLADLVDKSSRIAGGDFSARTRHLGRDELGQVGRSFNLMAEELSRLYRGLERQVAEKTAELSRSNQSLELLYRSISRLHDGPAVPETYRAILQDLEPVLGLKPGMAHLLAEDGAATGLPASDGEPGRAGRPPWPAPCEAPESWTYLERGQVDVLSVVLRDAEQTYGTLQLALPAGRRLEPWQEQLLRALARHMGIALGASHRSERERLLALQEERSVIARELHDSIAQALSYMKFQASLLQPVLSDPDRRPAAEATLADLREGINAAYRQLRELLATFRLRMDGDFPSLLRRTAEEYGARAGIPIHLETRLAGAHLAPNQEVHTLQIIREALANCLRHSHASQAWVRIAHEAGQVVVTVEDDGTGLAAQARSRPEHYGLSIMRERAEGLRGHLGIASRRGGGTVVTLRFQASATAPSATPAQEADAA
jgi:two-component system, NarL family, nitrate/nitrite sensor histidine kinase NarX